MQLDDSRKELLPIFRRELFQNSKSDCARAFRVTLFGRAKKNALA
jgi:hypothetical protein